MEETAPLQPSPPPEPEHEHEPRASTAQVGAVAGSVGLLVGFAAGLLVASTRSDAPQDAASLRAPAETPSVSAAPETLVGSSSAAPPAPIASAIPATPQGEAALHLDLHREDARSLLASGFYGVEGIDTEVPAVWSQGLTSTVSLPLTPATGDYVLVVTARTLASLAPLSVAVRLNGAELGKVSLMAAPAEVEVAVPNGTLKAGANELVLTYPRTAKPAATVHGSNDVRDLAINLFKLDLRPK